MRVVTLASQRAGAGKTMLAAHLAVEAGCAGTGPAALVDCDPEAVLYQWHRRRPMAEPVVTSADAVTLPRVLNRLRGEGVALAIVDTPAADRFRIDELIAAADFVIIPAWRTPDDSRSATAFAETVRRLDKPFVFVLNGALGGTAGGAGDTTSTLIDLAQYGTLATALIPESPVFRDSMGVGLTAMEEAGSSSETAEILRLWDYLSHRLDRIGGQPGGRFDPALSDSGEPSPSERRFFARKTGQLSGTLYFDRLVMRCKVLDISAGGVSVACPARVNAGDRVLIELGHVGRMTAQVRHVQGQRIGLEFEIGTCMVH